jgi:hypothetical protein
MEMEMDCLGVDPIMPSLMDLEWMSVLRGSALV